ncbi:EAL domain-containing protein [Herbiconiux sp. CPCC 203407]|uniref:EAL domain-containing protein n=1 Tax=Herbiconiux oxytropis TaxID=2970915 RepID=A0AA42BV51_9MICO|nr:EAL domain-containing protein [Herbiconiux oxytropis]MCS5723070.1 EAL domain-containing protein [Herbiconiux oxytropis]MCS5726861.1 EAL domain-containing protein [Herbiconiux oxytropis]
MTPFSEVRDAHFEAIAAPRPSEAPGGVDTVFQPIVSLETREVVAYEALTRPPRGSAFSSVVQLFEHAAAAGRTVELDQACWRSTLRAIDRVGSAAPFAVLVNVEPESFQAGIALDGPTAEGGAPPTPIVIELTERALLEAPGELLAMIERVREQGHAIAVDDLGADPASLALLPLIDPDIVKLDLGILQKQPDAGVARIMSALNTHLARRRIPVIAEGIETERQLVMARALGATHGQGWLFGRPERMPVAGGALAGIAGMPVGEGQAAPARSTQTPFEIVSQAIGSKPSDRQLLVQLSIFLEARARASGDSAVVVSTFQHASTITPATWRRYEDLQRECALVVAHVNGQVELPEGIRLAPIPDGDPLLAEWDIVVVTADFAAVLAARELDASRHGEGVYEFALSHDRGLAVAAAKVLLERSGKPLGVTL